MNCKNWISRRPGDLSDSGSYLPVTQGYVRYDMEIKSYTLD